MGQVYLSADSRTQIQDLIKDKKITQAKLAEMSGVSESIISRYLQGKTKNLGDGNIIKLAKALQVSTDFLLGETNIPDRKNYDIDELGLSAKAVKLLYSGKLNAKILNQLIEHPRFPLLIRLLARYEDETMIAGIDSMNGLLTLSNSLLFEHGKANPEDAIAVKKATGDILGQRIPAATSDTNTIQNIFMMIVRDIKKVSFPKEYTVTQSAITSETMENLRQNMHKGSESINLLKITPDALADHVTQVLVPTGLPEDLLYELKTILTKIMTAMKDKCDEQRIPLDVK